MNFFQKNNFPIGSSLTVQYEEQSINKYSIFLKDSNQKIIACGVYDPTIDQDSVKFIHYFSMTEPNYFKELNEAFGFRFILGDDSYFACPANSITQKADRNSSYNDFLKLIDTVFREQYSHAETVLRLKAREAIIREEQNQAGVQLKLTMDRITRTIDKTNSDGYNDWGFDITELESDLKLCHSWVKDLPQTEMISFKELCDKYGYDWMK